MPELNGFFDRVEKILVKWLDDFQTHPVKGVVQALVILYLVRFVRRGL